jgi:RNA ligase (TIGR02306 family)
MRKLASIQTVKYVKSIPDADSIETVGVLGWEVVSKKGEFQPGDTCVFFEIDSLLPEIPEFEFLRKSCWNDNLKKYRLKTVKLRKQLSQGLALSTSVFPILAGLHQPQRLILQVSFLYLQD